MWGKNLMTRQDVASNENNSRALVRMAEVAHFISISRHNAKYVQHLSKAFQRQIFSRNWFDLLNWLPEHSNYWQFVRNQLSCRYLFVGKSFFRD